MRQLIRVLLLLFLLLVLPLATPASSSELALQLDPDLETDGSAGTGVLPNFEAEGDNLIRLLAGAFDPLDDPLPAPTGIDLVDETTLPDGVPQYWLLQVQDKQFPQATQAVESAGGLIAGPVPDDTYMVRATLAQKQTISADPAVRWMGYYQPAWRIPVAAAGRDGLLDLEGLQRYVIHLFRAEPDKDGAKQALGALSDVHLVEETEAVVEVMATATEVSAIASVPAVEWVSVKPRAVLHNGNARWVNDTGVRDLYGATAPGRLTGAGQTAGVLDTGVNYTYDRNGRAHVGFRDCDEQGDCKEAIYTQANPGTGIDDMMNTVNHDTDHRKMVAYFDFGDAGPNMYDPSSHGTHVAGSVVGDQGDNGIWDGHDGMAPGARLVHQNAGTPSGGLAIPLGGFYDVLRQAYRPGDPQSVPTFSPAAGNVADYENYNALEDARTHNNSWGLIVPLVDATNAYNLDWFVWDHEDMVVVVSAGNSGPVPASIGSPSVAKNNLSSAASANGRQPMVSIDSIASFSSHGPTGDGRLGPDLATPGQIVVSAKGGTTDGYHAAQGTSMSGPVLTGLATLTREYFWEGYGPADGKGFPGGDTDAVRRHNPSAALVKATMVNGAVRMQGWYTGSDGTHRELDGQWPSEGQGFGLVNLDNSLYFTDDPVNTWYYDVWRGDGEAFAVADAEVTRSYEIEVQSGAPLDVSLAWTDAPNLNPAGTPSLVNNLDLIVVGPDGTPYVGNNLNSRVNPSVEVAETIPGSAAADVLNPVERVRIAGPAPGTYEVIVRADPILFGNQGFALAASGQIASPGATFTPGPDRQTDQPGDPAISNVAIEATGADTAVMRFETNEPTTAAATVPVNGADLTFVDSYNAGSEGFHGLDTGPVETSEAYADKPVTSTSHEVLLTGLDGGQSYDITLTVADLAGNETSEQTHYTSPAHAFQPDAPDIGQLLEGSTGGWQTGTQLYAGRLGSDGILGAFMFRIPEETVDPARITGAAVEMVSAHDWIVRYTQDPRFTVDLLSQEVESGWGTQGYDEIHTAPADARISPEMAHKRGDHQRYAFTLNCSDLDALRETLSDVADGERQAAFRFESTDMPGTGLFSADFGFNRRSNGPDLRPRLILFTDDQAGAYPDGQACDPSTPAPAVTEIGVHDGIQPDTAVVSWETDVPSNSVVLFREQGTEEWVQVGTPALTKIHHVQVHGLDREKDYEFVVRSTACNGETTTDNNGGEGYDFFHWQPQTDIPTETYFFDGLPTDQANKLAGFTAGDPSLYTATFNQEEPGDVVPIEQVGFGANPDYVANPLSNFWVAPYSGEIKGDVRITWSWSSANPETTLIGAGLDVSVWADPDLSSNPTGQTDRRIGRASARLNTLTPAPQQFEMIVPVDGTVEERLLIQAAPQFVDTGAGLTVYYGSASTPSNFEIPLEAPPPPPPGQEDLPLTGPAPPPSAGAIDLQAPPTRPWATPADVAAGTGICGTPDLAITAGDIELSAERVRGADEVTITATVHNAGTAGAIDVPVRFTDNGEQIGEIQLIDAIHSGDAGTASVVWYTRGLKGEHTLTVTVDPDGVIPEADTTNNSASVTVTVRGNKVQNASFEDSADGTSPDHWSAEGSTSYQEGGSDGDRSVHAGAGSYWLSDPIEVEGGQSYGFAVDVSGATGTLRLEQLSATGTLLATVDQSLVAVDDGFQTVTGTFTAAGEATQVRLRLEGGLGGTAFDNVWLGKE